jgi:hypothetical protein
MDFSSPERYETTSSTPFSPSTESWMSSMESAYSLVCLPERVEEISDPFGVLDCLLRVGTGLDSGHRWATHTRYSLGYDNQCTPQISWVI